MKPACDPVTSCGESRQLLVESPGRRQPLAAAIATRNRNKHPQVSKCYSFYDIKYWVNICLNMMAAAFM